MTEEKKVVRVTATAPDAEEQERYDAEFREQKKEEAMMHPGDEEVADQLEREASSDDVRRLLLTEKTPGRLLPAEEQREAARLPDGAGFIPAMGPAGHPLFKLTTRGASLYPHPDVEGPADDAGGFEFQEVNVEPHKVAAALGFLGELFDDRFRLYGENYKRFGAIMRALFPDGRLVIEDEHDFTRLGLFVQMVYKISRYASCFNDGGHRDSLDDLSVYSQMLAEIDEIDNP